MVVASIAGSRLATLWTTGWSLTALPRVDSKTKLGAVARALDPGFHTVHPGAYDGQFYWGIAVDPLATGDAHKAFDKPSYRYGHPLYGWLAWLVSAGWAKAVPAASGSGRARVACSPAAAICREQRHRAQPRRIRMAKGLFVALSPGLILFGRPGPRRAAGGGVAARRVRGTCAGRRATAWSCLALLPLVKEPLVLALAAVVGWELVHRRRERAAIFATAAVPALLWWTYARIHLGAWFTSGDTALGSPLAGWHSAPSSARASPSPRVGLATGPRPRR